MNSYGNKRIVHGVYVNTIHIMLNQIYQLSPLYVDGSIKRYLVVAASAILLAWLVKKAEDAILKAWDLRKQKSA